MLGTVWRGAGRHTNPIFAEVSKQGAKRNPGSERSGAALGTVWRGAGRHTKTKTSFSQNLDVFTFINLTFFFFFAPDPKKNTQLFYV